MNKIDSGQNFGWLRHWPTDQHKGPWRHRLTNGRQETSKEPKRNALACLPNKKSIGENPRESFCSVRRTATAAGVMVHLSPHGDLDLPQTPPKVYTETSSPSQQPLYSAVASDIGEPPTHFSPMIEMQDGMAVVDLLEEVTADSKTLWAPYIVGHFIGDAPI